MLYSVQNAHLALVDVDNFALIQMCGLEEKCSVYALIIGNIIYTREGFVGLQTSSLASSVNIGDYNLCNKTYGTMYMYMNVIYKYGVSSHLF